MLCIVKTLQYKNASDTEHHLTPSLCSLSPFFAWLTLAVFSSLIYIPHTVSVVNNSLSTILVLCCLCAGPGRGRPAGPAAVVRPGPAASDQPGMKSAMNSPTFTGPMGSCSASPCFNTKSSRGMQASAAAGASYLMLPFPFPYPFPLDPTTSTPSSGSPFPLFYPTHTPSSLVLICNL